MGAIVSDIVSEAESVSAIFIVTSYQVVNKRSRAAIESGSVERTFSLLCDTCLESGGLIFCLVV